jgi:hypothetical protein
MSLTTHTEWALHDHKTVHSVTVGVCAAGGTEQVIELMTAEEMTRNGRMNTNRPSPRPPPSLPDNDIHYNNIDHTDTSHHSTLLPIITISIHRAHRRATSNHSLNPAPLHRRFFPTDN